MRRLALALFLVLLAATLRPATGLALAPRALEPLASVPPLAAHGERYSLSTELRALLAPAQTRMRSRDGVFALRASPGPCIVTGQVLDYDGNPIAGVEVDLWCTGDNGVSEFVNSVTTAGDGSFEFSGVPETTDGEIDVYLDDGNGYQSWGNTFSASGPNDFTLRPGLTGAQVLRTSDPDWNSWQTVRVETWGTGGGGTTWIDGDSGDALVMAPDYDYAIAYPYDNQGIEWTAASSLPVTPGVSDGLAMTFDQADGRSAWIGSPYWQSGKPGTKVILVLENWPSGYQAAFYGYSQSPSGQETDWPFYVESDGSQYGFTTLTIPRTATPGYDYELHVWRYDDSTSGLDLTTYFQVATLKASRTSIRRGGALRLSGVIPTRGHMGSDLGKSKYVTLYRRVKAAAPPTVWNAAAKGWHKAGTFKANGLGKYATRLLHPRRTTWYVVRYPGDSWYYGAYTSVTRVVVRR